MMKRLLLTAVAASLLSSAFLISVPAAQAEEAAYKLVLLRHGESQWSLEKRFTGWSDDFSQVCERSSQWCELRYSQVQTAH